MGYGARDLHGLHGLQGMRALTAVALVLSYLCLLQEPLGRWFDRAFLLIDVFFVLSGFLLAARHGDRAVDRRQALHLLAGRLARLYPLLLVTLVCAVAVTPDPAPDTAGTEGLAPLAQGLAALREAVCLGGIPSGIAAWVVSAEFLVFAVLVGVHASAPEQRTRRLIVAALMGTCLGWYLGGGSVGLQSIGVPGPVEVAGPAGARAGLELQLVRALFAYGAGYLAQAVPAGWLDRVPPRLLGAAQVAVLVVIVIELVGAERGQLLAEIWLAGLWGALILLLAGGRGLIGHWLANRALGWLGARAYALTLTHGLVLATLLVLVAGVSPSLQPLLAALALPAYPLASLCVAHVLHVGVEMPALLWWRAWMRGRRQPAQAV